MAELQEGEVRSQSIINMLTAEKYTAFFDKDGEVVRRITESLTDEEWENL